MWVVTAGDVVERYTDRWTAEDRLCVLADQRGDAVLTWVNPPVDVVDDTPTPPAEPVPAVRTVAPVPDLVPRDGWSWETFADRVCMLLLGFVLGMVAVVGMLP